MTEEEDKKVMGQKNWLKEHDSIQVDLLKIKDELISEDDSIPEFEGVEEVGEKEIHEEVLPPQPKSTPQERMVQSEMTIKQMLGGIEKKKEKVPKEDAPKEPPRLEEGTIPSSPDLTNKIANVLQLEHKLKRRKFEMEKRTSQSKIPPPPKEPEHVQTEAAPLPREPAKVEVVPHRTIKKEPPKEPARTPEPKRKQAEKQIHVPSESPYPSVKKPKERPVQTPEEKEKEPEEELDTEMAEMKKKRKGLLALFSRNK